MSRTSPITLRHIRLSATPESHGSAIVGAGWQLHGLLRCRLNSKHLYRCYRLAAGNEPLSPDFYVRKDYIVLSNKPAQVSWDRARRCFAIDKLIALLRYLWTYLVARLGLLWWGVALAAGVLAAVGCVVVAHSRSKDVRSGRVLSVGLLAAYVAVVLAGTVAVRSRVAKRVVHPDVVGRLWRLFGQGHALDPEPLANMFMFVPVGFLFPVALGLGLGGTLLASLALSGCIETAQYLLACGECEPADVVLNVASSLVGYGAWWLTWQSLTRLGKRSRHCGE